MTVRFLGGVAERRRRFAFGPAPTFKQDFVTGGGGALPQGATFSRGTIGTLYNQSGLVAYAPSNLLTYSEQFNNAAWSQAGIDAFGSGSVANATTAPDGTLTADFLRPGTASSAQRTSQTTTVLTGFSYTQSYYVKSGGYSKIAIRESSATGYYVSFDVSTNSILASSSATGTITNVGNGWFRCTAYITAASTSWASSLYVLPASYTTGDPAIAWSGDGVSGVYVWGAQLEQGSNATTYTPTTTAAVYGPRFDYDPNNVLQQNLLFYSNTFTNASWVKVNTTVGITSALAPDGTNTATYVMNTVGSSSYFYQYVQSIFLPSTTYTRSFYAQLIVSGSGIIYSEIGGGIAAASFNLSTGVATSMGGSTVSQSMTPVGNGWYYCTHAFTSSATPSLSLSSVTLYMNTYGASANAQSIGLWNAQVNIGSTALPYLATTSTAQTVCAPRGLLIEEARTNLSLQSQDFTQAAWTKILCAAASNQIGVDGVTNSAQTITANVGTTVEPQVVQGFTAAAGAHTRSIYAKAGTAGFVALGFGSGIGADGAWFNLTTGVVGTVAALTTATITYVGNGFYRCTITRMLGAGAVTMVIEPHTADNQTTWSPAGTETIVIWGDQTEFGAFPTSYIPTTSATVTRNADSATVPTGTWYNTAQGTFVANFDANAIVATARIIGTQNPGAALSFFNGTGQVSIFDGTNAYSANTATTKTLTKAASTFVGSALSVCLNSGTVGTAAGAGTYPFSGTTTIGLGSQAGTSLFLNGHIRSFSYYNYALTNAQLQQVTT